MLEVTFFGRSYFASFSSDDLTGLNQLYSLLWQSSPCRNVTYLTHVPGVVDLLFVGMRNPNLPCRRQNHIGVKDPQII
jgi:hypothetical protein